MTDPESLKSDIAFLRELTQDGGEGLARDGVVLAVIGLVFAPVNLVYWLVFWGPLAGAKDVLTWLWVAGLAVMFLSIPLANLRFPRSSGAAARAMSTAWQGVGFGLLGGGFALLAAGMRLGDAGFVLRTFPILLFTLYGSAWGVAYAVKRLSWFALVSLGCFAAAILEGALYGSPHQWLVLSLGLLLLVGLPGLAIVRSARG